MNKLADRGVAKIVGIGAINRFPYYKKITEDDRHLAYLIGAII